MSSRSIVIKKNNTDAKNIKKYTKEGNLNQIKFSNRIGITNNIICMWYFFTWFWILGVVFGIGKQTSQTFAAGYFNIESSKISQLSSYFLIFDMIAVFFVGFGLLNISLKQIFCGAVLINILSCIGLLFATDNTQAIMCACCYGFGGGVCVLPMLNLSSQWFSPKNIGKAISLTVGGALSGSIIARLSHSYFGIDHSLSVGGKQVLMHGSQSGLPLLVTLIMLFCILISAVLLMREKKALIGQHKSTGVSFIKRIIKCITLKENWIVILFISLINLPVSVLLWSNGDSFVRYNYHNIKKSADLASWVMIILMFGNIIGSFLWGWLTDRLGKRKPIMMICAFLICIITYFTTIRALPVSLLFIIFFLIGFLSASQNIGYPILAEQNASKLIGVTFIFNSIIILGGGAAVQQIFAKVMPQISNQSPKAPSVASTFILPILMTVPLIVSFFITETGYQASNKSKAKVAKRIAYVEASMAK